MFITFEGIDGCGKTTQVELLEKYLREQNFSILVTREPGGTEFAEKCRDLLKKYSESISPKTQAFLISAARRDHYEKVLKPNLKIKDFIICDRYIDSFEAYQRYTQGVHPQCISELVYWSIGSCFPDLTFFLDIDPKLALNRIKERNEKDYFDSEKIEFFEKLRDGYKKIASQSYNSFNGTTFSRFITIDASKNIDEIHNIVLNGINYILKLVAENSDLNDKLN